MADTDKQEDLKDPIPGAPDDYRLANYAGVEDDTVQWLWYPYIPFGMIAMVQGYPGSGKSSMLLDIIARSSRGEVLPDGSKLSSPVPAVYARSRLLYRHHKKGETGTGCAVYQTSRSSVGMASSGSRSLRSGIMKRLRTMRKEV